jgi:hypothetical protein
MTIAGPTMSCEVEAFGQRLQHSGVPIVSGESSLAASNKPYTDEDDHEL